MSARITNQLYWSDYVVLLFALLLAVANYALHFGAWRGTLWYPLAIVAAIAGLIVWVVTAIGAYVLLNGKERR